MANFLTQKKEDIPKHKIKKDERRNQKTVNTDKVLTKTDRYMKE